MECKRCGHQIETKDIICPNCGEEFALKEQKTILNEISVNKKNIIPKHFTNKIFLYIAICVSIISGLSLLVSFTSLYLFIKIINYYIEILYIENDYTFLITFIVSLASFGVSLVTTIMSWMIYKQKKECTHKSIMLFNIYNTFEFIVSLILLVLTIIASFFGFLEATADSLFSIFPFVFFMAIIYFIVINVFLANKRINEYVIALAKTCETNEYKFRKSPPYYCLFVLGIMEIICGFDLLGLSLIEISFETEIIIYILYIFSALLSIVMGIYIIISAIFFKSIHEQEERLQIEYDIEKKTYDQLVKQTIVAKSKFIKPQDKINE